MRSCCRAPSYWATNVFAYEQMPSGKRQYRKPGDRRRERRGHRRAGHPIEKHPVDERHDRPRQAGDHQRRGDAHHLAPAARSAPPGAIAVPVGIAERHAMALRFEAVANGKNAGPLFETGRSVQDNRSALLVQAIN